MTKILNKLFLILKTILLPVLLVATIYIVVFMFQRLEKELFGANFMEFLSIVFPYLLLIVLTIMNFFLKQKRVLENTFYNITSFLVMLTVVFFCYRACFDQNMYLWHKYGYNINFNYFSDQIAPMKVMLYGLSISNILLMIEEYLSRDKKMNKEDKKEKLKFQTEQKKENKT